MEAAFPRAVASRGAPMLANFLYIYFISLFHF